MTGVTGKTGTTGMTGVYTCGEEIELFFLWVEHGAGDGEGWGGGGGPVGQWVAMETEERGGAQSHEALERTWGRRGKEGGGEGRGREGGRKDCTPFWPALPRGIPWRPVLVWWVFLGQPPYGGLVKMSRMGELVRGFASFVLPQCCTAWGMWHGHVTSHVSCVISFRCHVIPPARVVLLWTVLASSVWSVLVALWAAVYFEG